MGCDKNFAKYMPITYFIKHYALLDKAEEDAQRNRSIFLILSLMKLTDENINELFEITLYYLI